MGNSCSPVAGGVFDGVLLCCPFSPRDVLDEIWDLIESVSEGFPTYSSRGKNDKERTCNSRLLPITTNRGNDLDSSICCY